VTVDPGKRFEQAIDHRFSEYIDQQTREKQDYLERLSSSYKDFFAKILLETICFNELRSGSSSVEGLCRGSESSVKLTLPILISGLLIDLHRLQAYVSEHSDKTQAFRDMFREMNSMRDFGRLNVT
jgi:hypothetical protein